MVGIHILEINPYGPNLGDLTAVRVHRILRCHKTLLLYDFISQHSKIKGSVMRIKVKVEVNFIAIQACFVNTRIKWQ